MAGAVGGEANHLEHVGMAQLHHQIELGLEPRHQGAHRRLGARPRRVQPLERAFRVRVLGRVHRAKGAFA